MAVAKNEKENGNIVSLMPRCGVAAGWQPARRSKTTVRRPASAGYPPPGFVLAYHNRLVGKVSRGWQRAGRWERAEREGEDCIVVRFPGYQTSLSTERANFGCGKEESTHSHVSF